MKDLQKQATFTLKSLRSLALGALTIIGLQVRVLAASNGDTATGAQALSHVTTGINNTANGAAALFNTTVGSSNTAVGFQAGYNLTIGTNNIGLGSMAGFNLTSGNNNIDIGHLGVAGDNGIIRIGTLGLQTNTIIVGVINGDGTGLSNLNAAQLFGKLPLAVLPGAVVTNGESGVNLSGSFTGNGTGLTSLSASSITTGTLPPNVLPSTVLVNNEANASLGALNLNVLNLPASTANAGFVSIGGYPVLQAYAGNFFAGGSGNFSLTGGENVGLGPSALYFDTSGSLNTASGFEALFFNTSGSFNTANGALALENNTTGGANTASGAQALYSNTSGVANTASGSDALHWNTTGSFNTASGRNGLFSNTNGSYNTAVGNQALYSNTSGSTNIALGFGAGANLTTGNNNIDIGNQGVVGDDGIIRIGTPGTHTATILAGTISGDGSGLSNLNSARLTGTVPLGAIPAAVVTNGASAINLTGSFVGNGSGLTAINAGNITSGILPLAQLPASVLLTNQASASLGNLNLNGTLSLPATSPTSGFISIGGNTVFHTYGSDNFFSGSQAGNFWLTGSGNVGIGSQALSSDTSGPYNTAVGWRALASNTTGGDNTAEGRAALYSNSTGSGNTAIGDDALLHSDTGWANTALGDNALYYNTNGSGNIAVGANALLQNSSGSNNIALGYWAGTFTTGDNNIDIGNQGVAGESGTIRIGTPGTHTTTVIAGVINGDGEGLSNLNSAQLIGTVPLAALPTAVVTNGASAINLTGFFTGDGSGLTVLNASSLTSGTIPLSSLPAAVVTNNEASANFGSLTLNGTLNLPLTTAAVGFINIGGIRVLHAYGTENFFSGQTAGNSAITGAQNVGFGPFALGGLSSGALNTATGDRALFGNTTGWANTANGALALASNTVGQNNVANGLYALLSNTNGDQNTALGADALLYNTSGNYNIGLGALAGFQLTTGSYNIDIGNYGVAGESYTIRIGTQGTHTNTIIAGFINGDGGGLSNLNSAQLTGRVPLAAMPGAVVTNGAAAVNLTGRFSGDGSGLSGIKADVLTQEVMDLLAPPGTIIAWMGTSNVPPTGWELCWGQEVSRTDPRYSRVFSTIGISNGGGDGTTTFNLPDLRGMFLRGVNGARADAFADPDAETRTNSPSGGLTGNSGNTVGSVQADEFSSHRHTMDLPYVGAAVGPLGVWGNGGWGTATDGLSTKTSGGAETRPKNVYVQYLIKL